MTNEQIITAIAQACGWALDHKGAIRADGYRSELWGKPPHEAFPNYLNDLNAMHEAEVWLYDTDFILYTVYIDNLTDICSCAHKMSAYRESATAAQRAEAFLRTLDLWQETK